MANPRIASTQEFHRSPLTRVIVVQETNQEIVFELTSLMFCTQDHTLSETHNAGDTPYPPKTLRKLRRAVGILSSPHRLLAACNLTTERSRPWICKTKDQASVPCRIHDAELSQCFPSRPTRSTTTYIRYHSSERSRLLQLNPFYATMPTIYNEALPAARTLWTRPDLKAAAKIYQAITVDRVSERRDAASEQTQVVATKRQQSSCRSRHRPGPGCFERASCLRSWVHRYSSDPGLKSGYVLLLRLRSRPICCPPKNPIQPGWPDL